MARLVESGDTKKEYFREEGVGNSFALLPLEKKRCQVSSFLDPNLLLKFCRASFFVAADNIIPFIIAEDEEVLRKQIYVSLSLSLSCLPRATKTGK